MWAHERQLGAAPVCPNWCLHGGRLEDGRVAKAPVSIGRLNSDVHRLDHRDAEIAAPAIRIKPVLGPLKTSCMTPEGELIHHEPAGRHKDLTTRHKGLLSRTGQKRDTDRCVIIISPTTGSFCSFMFCMLLLSSGCRRMEGLKGLKGPQGKAICGTRPAPYP